MTRVILGFLSVLLVAFENRAHAQVWSQTGAPGGSWEAVVSSADGTKLAGALYPHIYTSTNAGATWSSTSAPSKNWTALASSSDGSVLLATASGGGGLYTSTNYGNTWQSNTVPSGNWDTVAMSTNGNTLIVGANVSGPVYYSTNRGTNWSSNGIPAGGYWTSVVCSADGSKLAATWSGVVYLSTNSGAIWTSNNTVNGSVLACSADGSRLLISTPGLHLSTNWGATFTPVTIPYTSSTIQIAGSADGKRLLALVGGSLYLSTNSGATWSTNYAPNNNWTGVTMCPSGTKMFAASTVDIYDWQQPALNMTNTAGNLVFSWSTNGTSFGLQRNADLKTTNWVAVTNTPIITNSVNQVTLSPSNNAGFFRLISQ